MPALSIAVQLRQPVLAASLLNAVDPRVEVDAARVHALFAVGSNDRNVVQKGGARTHGEQSGGWGPLPRVSVGSPGDRKS